MGSLRTKDAFGSATKIQETHKQPIYGLDWSIDVYYDDGDGGIGKAGDNYYDSNDHYEAASHHYHHKKSKSRSAGSSSSHSKPRYPHQHQHHHTAKARRMDVDDNATLFHVLASCAGRYVNIYQLPMGAGVSRSEPLSLIQMYVDGDVKEQFYTCVFAGRSTVLGEKDSRQSHPEPSSTTNTTTRMDRESRRPTKLRRVNTESPTVLNSRGEGDDDEESSSSRLWPLSGETGTGPQFLCVAGHKGTIKLIDLLRKRLAATLVGHGYEIYDLKQCPTDEYMLASASKDNTARLWNLKTGAQVAVLSGHEGHLDDVVSVAWHVSGHVIATGSMDTTVKLWYVGPGTVVRRAIQNSHAAAQELVQEQRQRITETRVTELQIPIFTTYQLHFYCVDCVHFLGDWILSRSQEDAIVLWEPQFPPPKPKITATSIITTTTTTTTSTLAAANNDKDDEQKNQDEELLEEEEKEGEEESGSSLATMWRRTKTEDMPYPVPNQLKHIRTFKLHESQYWFFRFGVDRRGKTLVAGNAMGDISVWKIPSFKSKAPIKVLDGKMRNHAAVRFICFSPDDSVMVAATDLGEIWKWDVRREKPVPITNTTTTTTTVAPAPSTTAAAPEQQPRQGEKQDAPLDLSNMTVAYL